VRGAWSERPGFEKQQHLEGKKKTKESSEKGVVEREKGGGRRSIERHQALRKEVARFTGKKPGRSRTQAGGKKRTSGLISLPGGGGQKGGLLASQIK